MSLWRQNNDTMRTKNSDLINKAFKLYRAGKDKTEIARLCKVHVRTVQRWLSDESVFAELEEIEKNIIESDPLIFTVTEVRAQVQEILDYRDSQKVFALEMGEVVFKSVRLLKTAVERLENNSDELTARNIPSFMRAVTDAAEKVSNAWLRTTGLEDLLDRISDEPKVIEPREVED
jgi:hypothetical protein